MREKIGNRQSLFVVSAVCVLIMLMIFLFSSQPAEASSETSGGVVEVVANAFGIEKSRENINILTIIIRKLGHFSEYALLGGAYLFFFSHFESSKGTKLGISFFASVGYALTDEIHQNFVPGRAMRLMDVGIDALGSVAGILIAVIIIALFLKRKNKKK